MPKNLTTYATALQEELINILEYWSNFSIDHTHGGFVGRIDNNQQIYENEPKGAVLNARILWSFSAGYRLLNEPRYLTLASGSYAYIAEKFIDHEYGGVYWLLDAYGNPIDPKKQIYAIAFTIYGLSEYHLASKNEEARQTAIQMYQDLVKYSYDHFNGGYFEAFSREWGILDDLRLSDKDANEKKTMNTHLHILEAFTALYGVWPDQELGARISALIDDFTDKILHKEGTHLQLFFDELWMSKSNTVSYGHDIEASWLIQKAAEMIEDPERIMKSKKVALKLAKSVASAIDKDGGLWYEKNIATQKVNKEKHWWVQAEAMVGFFNAWQIESDQNFFELSLQSWQFVKHQIRDLKHGEWFWGIDKKGLVMQDEDKVGIWKCPYHNSRACIEIIKRSQKLNMVY